MKKILLLSGLAFASMCHGFFSNGDSLIVYNEPINVRIVDVFRYDFYGEVSEYYFNQNYNQDAVVTNVSGNSVAYNYTEIIKDYQVELLPQTIGGSYTFASYELGAATNWVEKQFYISSRNGRTIINVQRIVGYKVGDNWVDKDGKNIDYMLNMISLLNQVRENQKNSRLHPDMQLNSVISMTENTPKISFDIVYSGEKVVWGKKELTDSEWVDVTDVDKSEYRFFKVSLKSN